MSANSDLDIFMDMMSDQESPYVEVVEQGKDNSYYQGLGIHILKQLDNKEHYFHFVSSILQNYHILDKEKREELNQKLGVIPEIIIKEKIVFKVEKTKQIKPKLNMNTTDDY